MYLSLLLPCLIFSSIPWGASMSRVLDQDCDFPNAVYTIPGDAGFMGIFNLHRDGNCSTDNGPEFDTLQNVIQTIQRLNRLGNTVPGGMAIGLHVYDACSTATKAEKAIVNALFDMECSHTYSLGLLSTSQVSSSLSSIISNLHLPVVSLQNQYALDLPLLFNGSFSFLQSIQVTTIHVAILPDVETVGVFSNLATNYRLCVNNPMSYRHVEDSKDKILPLYSDYATAVLVGTLEQYRAHVSYITSVSRNILFIATDLPSQYEEKYFEGLRNGTLLVSPYLYEPGSSEEDLLGQDKNEHPFIQRLNQKYPFNINMKFVQNSLKIHRTVENFKLKYKDDCGEKSFRNCSDLKPLRSETNEVRNNGQDKIHEFINSFQVDNMETSVNGIYVYQVFKSEREEETAQATALLPAEEPQEQVEDAKKKLLLDINNTNFENMGKRDLILNSIHIVTSEAYETDMLNLEKNQDSSTAEEVEYFLNDEPTPNVINGFDAHNNLGNVTNETDDEENYTLSVSAESKSIEGHNVTSSENDTDIQMQDPLKDLIRRYTVVDKNNQTNTSKSFDPITQGTDIADSKSGNDTALTSIEEKESEVDVNVLKNKILENRRNYLQERILMLNQNVNKTSVQTEQKHDSRKRRSVRNIRASKKVQLESLGKYTYVNNTWIVVLNEEENLREGSEQFLCKIINEDNYTDNETASSPGKDCSACYNFREIYQLIELNKQDVEASKKRILDIVLKVDMKTDSFTVVIISLSAMGLIASVVILGFIVYRIIQQDVLEGNPTITILLLLSIIYNYVVIAPFVVDVEQGIEYFDYYTHLLCYIRLISIITSFNFIFSLLLTRCLMLSFCDHDGALMSHINGYIQSSFCFFITIIQVLFIVNLFLIKYIFNVDIKCDIIEGNYIFMLGYNIILLFLLLLTIPFIYKCRRNYFEGVYLTITIVSIAVAWFIWIYLYIDSNYNESLLMLGIFVTSTIILIIIFIPRTYHMIINIVRDNITSILPALSSQYMSAGNIHNVHYRSTQALYDIVNDGENKHLGEVNPYYVSRNESKLRPNTIYQSNQNGEQGLESYYLGKPSRDEEDPTSIYNEEITGRLNSSLGLHNLKSPSHRQSPSFKCRVRSPSIKSRANSPPQMEDLYDTSQYETTSRCETSRFDTPSTMTRF